MLAERSRASDDDSLTSVVSPAGAGPASAIQPGSRSARKRKRGLLRRSGIAVPAACLALLLVVVVWGAARVMHPKGTGASSLFQSIDGLGNSGSVALLEQERQTVIAMTAASKTLSVAAKPVTANPTQILAAEHSSTSTSASTTGGTAVTTTAPPADPTAAEQIGKSMLASFGFDTTTQWPCLYDLWQRESGWNVYAENAASGAYGIPQSLPGYKMQSSGKDWQTNPATQINWGLGYIKGTYGTPCHAWQNELNYGYY
jgi:hypothetical protein